MKVWLLQIGYYSDQYVDVAFTTRAAAEAAQHLVGGEASVREVDVLDATGDDLSVTVWCRFSASFVAPSDGPIRPVIRDQKWWGKESFRISAEKHMSWHRPPRRYIEVSRRREVVQRRTGPHTFEKDVYFVLEGRAETEEIARKMVADRMAMLTDHHDRHGELPDVY